MLGNVSIEDGKFIRTLCFQASTYHVDAKSPLVMLHGLGGGIPSFHKNFKGLYKDREVYAVDLPGFALSTRMQFVGEAEDCIRMYVEMLDKWRQKLKINKFAILGHSFGGYIASAYAVRYPARIESLILVDPWGIMPQGENDVDKGSALWQKGATELAGLLKGAPFGMLRSTGPLGELTLSRCARLEQFESCSLFFCLISLHHFSENKIFLFERSTNPKLPYALVNY